MIELTENKKIRLTIYKLVGADKAAAEKAIEFVNDDPLRYEVFTDRYGRVTTEYEYQANGPVAKVIKVCSDAEDTLLLFVDRQAEQAEGYRVLTRRVISLFNASIASVGILFAFSLAILISTIIITSHGTVWIYSKYTVLFIQFQW